MGHKFQGAGARPASSGAATDGFLKQEVGRARNARPRAANGRFAPRAIACRAREDHGLSCHSDEPSIGDLIDAEDLADLTDLGGQEDDAGLFDKDIEAWTRAVGLPKHGGTPKWSALDGSVSAPTKASYLAHRLQALWREAERERQGQPSRLEARPAWHVDDMTFKEQCGRLQRRLGTRSQCIAPPPPSCQSCGTPLVEPNSRLCHRCQQAEDAALALALRSLDAAARTSPERDCAGSCAKSDPIDNFAESEFGADQVSCTATSVPPGRQKASPEASDVEGWRRLFWLLALLAVCIGIAASVYGLDEVSLSSKEGASYAGQ